MKRKMFVGAGPTLQRQPAKLGSAFVGACVAFLNAGIFLAVLGGVVWLGGVVVAVLGTLR